MKNPGLLLVAILFLAGCEKEKIKICHRDSKNGTSHTISISPNAWPAHQAHGDVLGECSPVPTVSICNQVWTLRNLDVTTYRNGDPIPQVTDETQWTNLTTGAWCYYNNDPAFGQVYGKIYNWYALNDPRGLAPAGWHIPNNAEWTELINCLGGESIAGGAMKSTETIELDQNGLIDELAGKWAAPNTGATNSSGFTALPGGFRSYQGWFGGAGFNAEWWSITENGPNEAYEIGILYKFVNINPLFPLIKANGFSVRCVKD